MIKQNKLVKTWKDAKKKEESGEDNVNYDVLLSAAMLQANADLHASIVVIGEENTNIAKLTAQLEVERVKLGSDWSPAKIINLKSQLTVAEKRKVALKEKHEEMKAFIKEEIGEIDL